jgi:uncharacterized protein YukE
MNPFLTTDLAECATPEQVPATLRRIADRFAESTSELQSAWQDPSAGKVWQDFANILNRAAQSCENAIARRGL